MFFIMTIPKQYQKPIVIAILLHIAILCILIFNFASETFRAPPSSAPQQIIHATAIMQTTTAPAMEAKATEQKHMEAKAQATAKLAAHKAAEKKHMEAKATAKKHMEAEAKATAKLAAQAQATAKLAAHKAAEKKHMEAQAKLAARAQATAKLAKAQKQLQQQLMAQQLKSDEKNMNQVQTSLAQQGVIDKYKAQILSLVQSNWHIDRVNAKLKCVYSVTLAPDGSVLSETLVKSSGDDSLDQSAKQAIIASSPLPVPNDPALFNNFRQLMLTLSPQGYLS